MANKNTKLNRRQFLNQLHFQLIEPLLRVRIEIPTLSKTLKNYIRDILEIEDKPSERPEPKILHKRVRCAFCRRERDRKTKMLCSKCQLSVDKFAVNVFNKILSVKKCIPRCVVLLSNILVI